MEKFVYKKDYTIEVKDGKAIVSQPWLGFADGFFGKHIRKVAEFDSVEEAKEAIDDYVELDDFLESSYED